MFDAHITVGGVAYTVSDVSVDVTAAQLKTKLLSARDSDGKLLSASGATLTVKVGQTSGQWVVSFAAATSSDTSLKIQTALRAAPPATDTGAGATTGTETTTGTGTTDPTNTDTTGTTDNTDNADTTDQPTWVDAEQAGASVAGVSELQTLDLSVANTAIGQDKFFTLSLGKTKVTDDIVVLDLGTKTNELQRITFLNPLENTNKKYVLVLGDQRSAELTFANLHRRTNCVDFLEYLKRGIRVY